MNNTVTIICPVYNSSKYLANCIDSVIAQTNEDWEMVLADDCSLDDSVAIIQEYKEKDGRIKLVQMSQNGGTGIARNRAIELATGRYIAFLDSDDLWHPRKLELQLKFMKENNLPFTFTSYNLVDEFGNQLSKTFDAIPVITYGRALFKNPIGCLTVIYDTKFFGKQYMPNIRKRQDYALWLKLLKKTNAYGFNKVLASYRYGNQSISSNKIDLIKYEWKIYRDIEGLSLFRSSFYLLSAIVLKLRSYF
ncbi:glycosyltransferase family 2 protein [Flagellimonas sp.]|uniref:glycosyltransferase family 2 protein n=1 Tax=Flagellimonas sp. TaxID=2058762 RepID=UPI003B50AC56